MMHKKKNNRILSTFNFQLSTRGASRGFALLYTVIVISLILSISLSISNVTYKQTILSSLARDSQAAFYQADAGVECGLYYDVGLGYFPAGTTLATVQSTHSTLSCGGMTLALSAADSGSDYFLYKENVSNQSDPCYTVVFDKTSGSGPVSAVSGTIEARGHNMCATGPRQVERALRVTY